MTKLIIACSCSLALLTTPTFAAPASPTPASTMQVAFKVDGRHYTVKLVDQACGSVLAKSATVRDEIKVCARADGAGVHLDVEWQLHDKDRDIETKSEMILPRGATQELDGGTSKLSVTLG
jgi:hypothetical protein